MVTYVFVATYPLDPWTILGDPSRRAIIERLSTGACTVAGLAAEMPISRPAVSQHLKVLKDAGVVQDQPSGKHRIYSLDAARLDRYRRQLDQFWSGALSNLAAADSNDREGEAG